MASSHRAFKAVSHASTGAVLRIVSYNILANKYVMTGYHDYCPEQYRGWQYRLPRLCREISDLRGDIVCLQEVEEEVFRQDIGSMLRQQGFEGWHHPRSSDIKGPKEGPCLFVRTSSFEIHAHSAACLRDALSDSRRGAFWDLVRDGKREDGAVLALLTHRQTGRKLLAASTHLYWHPAFPDIKLAQAELLCKMMVDFLKERNEASTIPILLGGDFNSLWGKWQSDPFDQVPPGECLVSGVYELLTMGTVTSSHHDHPAKRRGTTDVADFTTHGLVFQSSYKLADGRDPPVTNATREFMGCLDYIFLRGPFDVTEVLEMPYEDKHGSKESLRDLKKDVQLGPIPNEAFPSDHLSICCSVELQ